MTFGKPQQDESVIAPAVVEGTCASRLASCSTVPGQTVSASADTIIVERGRVRGIERLTCAHGRRAQVELVAAAFARGADNATMSVAEDGAR